MFQMLKDIGISDIDIALIYTVLPFTVFIAPPLVGFLADRLGILTSAKNLVKCMDAFPKCKINLVSLSRKS